MVTSDDYRRGHRDGFHEAKLRYVLFDGVQAPGRDAYIVRYDADARPWVALLDYSNALVHALEVATERIEQAEAMRERAYDGHLEASHHAAERDEERRQAGGVRRYAARLLHAVDSELSHAKSKVNEAEREFDRWCNQAALLRAELDEVNVAVDQMTQTVRKAEQA